MINVEDLSKHFVLPQSFTAAIRRQKAPRLRAVDGVSFAVEPGKVMGLVGESGCGKSTLARLLVGLETPTQGNVYFGESNALALKKQDRRAFHRRVQMVFQDPYGSLNPQQRIGEIVTRPLIYQRNAASPQEKRKLAITALEEAGLSPADDYLEKFPHQLSGGQRQRVCIARAIVLEPELLIADEPISMLDVSIKWGIIQLLKRLVRERGLAMIYITHDLSSAGSICDTLAVMYLGRIVEHGPTQEVIRNPQHPYTKALLASTPSIDPEFRRKTAQIKGAIPDAVNLSGGCRFHPRCPIAQPVCARVAPQDATQREHGAACHFAFDLEAKQEDLT
ncbi:ABC transporter ATP-binding protein [Sulfitobacter sp. F26204]|uniref:ABC transporter ATP-binding protein n=1 Tax=Sulfitobacter sp. F26204 TaxID=2996014 RepID=UPI00225E15C5|nr:ABC transporter ATP-binding protein [Sulfitobacter sp. F26204]MCX7561288.1 ABC transporter ATP-binding protein [Sulfitobacter sp. F26204]